MIIEASSDFHLSYYTKKTQDYPWCPWIFNGNDEPQYGALLVGEANLESGENTFEYKIELKNNDEQ